MEMGDELDIIPYGIKDILGLLFEFQVLENLIIKIFFTFICQKVPKKLDNIRVIKY